MRHRPRTPLAVTLGDPAGIGPELILRAWLDARGKGGAAFVAVADVPFLSRVATSLHLDVPVRVSTPAEAADVFKTALPVIDLGHPIEAKPGAPSRANGAAVLASIEQAVRLVHDSECSAVVTSPIAKHVLRESGFHFAGHTDYLGALASELWGRPATAVMLLWSEALAVVPVTVHVPLADVPRLLTTDLLVETGRIVAHDLRDRFGIAKPRLAIAGLNPHAGESGMLGFEEQEVIAPAIDILRAEGIAASGPYPADTMFHAQARQGYDVVLAMYHDQALVPIKTLAFDEAVNVTLGLPFVRTSPDHGTAFDIAGKGVARPDSFVAALNLADRLARVQSAATTGRSTKTPATSAP